MAGFGDIPIIKDIPLVGPLVKGASDVILGTGEGYIPSREDYTLPPEAYNWGGGPEFAAETSDAVGTIGQEMLRLGMAAPGREAPEVDRSAADPYEQAFWGSRAAGSDALERGAGSYEDARNALGDAAGLIGKQESTTDRALDYLPKGEEVLERSQNTVEEMKRGLGTAMGTTESAVSDLDRAMGGFDTAEDSMGAVRGGLDEQNAALGLTRSAALGEAPSVAEELLNQGVGDFARARQAAASSGRGFRSGAAAGAARASEAQANRANQQMAQLRAGEMAQARDAYGNQALGLTKNALGATDALSGIAAGRGNIGGTKGNISGVQSNIAGGYGTASGIEQNIAGGYNDLAGTTADIGANYGNAAGGMTNIASGHGAVGAGETAIGGAYNVQGNTDLTGLKQQSNEAEFDATHKQRQTEMNDNLMTNLTGQGRDFIDLSFHPLDKSQEGMSGWARNQGEMAASYNAAVAAGTPPDTGLLGSFSGVAGSAAAIGEAKNSWGGGNDSGGGEGGGGGGTTSSTQQPMQAQPQPQPQQQPGQPPQRKSGRSSYGGAQPQQPGGISVPGQTQGYTGGGTNGPVGAMTPQSSPAPTWNQQQPTGGQSYVPPGARQNPGVTQTATPQAPGGAGGAAPRQPQGYAAVGTDFRLPDTLGDPTRRANHAAGIRTPNMQPAVQPGGMDAMGQAELGAFRKKGQGGW